MADVLSNRFSSTGFNPDKYVQELTLTSLKVNDLLASRQRVQILAEETSGLLKKNVYKNYTQFIETAKEISYLESEMYQLSHMLTEHQSVLNSFSKISIAGQKAVVSSEREPEAGDDENGKNLSSLLEKVEGCANIFEVRGRSVVHDGELVKLSSHDFKQRQQVYVVLLTDSLLLATKVQNRRGPVQYRFQALYELENLSVVSMKEDPYLKNAFKILVFPDTHIFLCISPPAKREWVSIIEQRKKLKTPSAVTDASDDKSILNSFDYELGNYEINKSETYSWLMELPEDLDVCIAQRDFEAAVKLINDANEHFAKFPETAALNEISSRIGQRIKYLVNTLMNELRVSPDRSLQGGPRAAQRAVSLLIRLGKSSQACDLFLKRHTAILKQLIRQQKIEGAMVTYIKRLCSVFFNRVIDTGREFNEAFSSSNRCASAFVVWAKSQLQQFVQTFSRQVFTTQVSPPIAAECVEVIRGHCDQLLEIGLNLSFVLNTLLQNKVESIIIEIQNKLLEAIKLRAAEDKWRPQNFQNKVGLNKFLEDMKEIGIANAEIYVYDECLVSLTANTTSFTKAYFNSLDDLLKLYIPTFHQLISNALTTTFCAQLKHVEVSLQNETSKDEIKLIQKNGSFLLGSVLMLAEHRYREKLGHPCTSLAAVSSKFPSLSGSGATESKTSFPKYSSTTFL